MNDDTASCLGLIALVVLFPFAVIGGIVLGVLAAAAYLGVL